MEGFKEGFDFFADHASYLSSIAISDAYVDGVNNKIGELCNNLSHFDGMKTDISQLKGDVAEFWHAGTFNIDAAVKGSGHRVQVDRSHDFGSVDISGKNFDASYGLKYYKTGAESAKQQAKSVFEAYSKHSAEGGKESLEEYLKNRGYQDDSVLNDPVYSGQIRVIPSDQLQSAQEWLKKKIENEAAKRPEQVGRYKETLAFLRDKVSDNKGNESITLSEEDAKELARLAKEGNIGPEKLGLTTEELIKYEYLLKQAFKAGLTAATISIVLKTAPEIVNAIKYLIDNGEIEEGEFEKIGFAALKGGSEGFVRGTVSASITTACKAGLLGDTLKTVDPSIVGMVTVLTMDSMKNAYRVSRGDMTRNEMANELIRSMFTSTCSLALGTVTQGFIEVPVLGYMIGSFVGSLVGSFAYSTAYSSAISFCIDTGFTVFGLVDQNYQLPDDVLKEIGIEVFEYEKFEYEQFDYKKFEYKTFEYGKFQPEQIEMSFLRRGVIGINRIGYVA